MEELMTSVGLRRPKLLLVTASLCCGPVLAAVPPPTRADIPPVIDGKLDDPVWQGAKFYDDFKIMESDKPATRRTEFAVAYTDNAIVFGFKAFVPDGALVITPGERSLFDECVEVMLDPSGGTESYFHFCVGANGALYDRVCEQGGHVGDKSWESGFAGEVMRIDDRSWSAEVSIPFRAPEFIDASSESWSLNVARESGELSSIARKGRFNSAGSFLRMAAPKVDFSPFFWETAPPEAATRIEDGRLAVDLSVKIKNLTGTTRKVRVGYALTPPAGTILFETRPPRKFAVNAASTVNFKTVRLDTPGEYGCEISVRDADTNRLLVRRGAKLALDFVPVTVELIDPHYRNAIFATQELDEVRYTVRLALDAANMRLRSGIRAVAGNGSLAEETVAAKSENRFEFPVEPLPYGRLEVFAELTDRVGKEAAQAAIPLRKLPYLQNEVWRGKDRNWYVDGKKVFLLLAWNYPHFHFPEYVAFMPSREEHGWHGGVMSELGFGLTSAGIRPIMDAAGITPEVEEFFRRRVKSYVANPKLFGHYWVDEPDCQGMTREIAAEVAAIVADQDPYHPVIVSTGTNGITAYPDCGEINGFHCYPNPEIGKPMANFMKIVGLMDKARRFFGDDVAAQSIAYLHQGFNYGDAGSRNSRIPSYEEWRNQDILSLILGAQGLMHYNVFHWEFPELYIGMKELVKEQKIIGEEAVIQNPPRVKPTASKPHIRLRAQVNDDGSAWLLACNASYQADTGVVTWPELGNKKLQVLSEDRSIAPENGRFTDRFGPFEARVYTTSDRDLGLKTVKETNALIEAEYSERAKPGNLAYQRFEDSKLTVNASSNKHRIGSGPASNTLWHVTDGVTRDNRMLFEPACFSDNTLGEVPDWIELVFHKPVTVGRVVVYPDANTLRDYEVQIRKDGEYVPVASVKDAEGECLTSSFGSETTDAVRISVTANRGTNTRIYEVEVYEE